MPKLLIILLLLLPYAAHSSELDSVDNLRNFFTTPHERNQLDQMRAAGKFSGQKSASTISIIREPLTVRMKGVVIRENNKPVIFVNDGNTLKSSQIDEINVHDSQTPSTDLKVPVKVNQQRLKLKPGERWSEVDNIVQENYQIKPSKAEPDGKEKPAVLKHN